MKFRTVPTVSLAAAVLALALSLAPGAAWSGPKPEPNPCIGLTGMEYGLCNAYCRALDCPAGHPGNACSSLLRNWRRMTGQPMFPCDQVCCQCTNGARACASARRCLAASGCTIVARCVDGRCPAVPTATPTPTAEPTATPAPACPCGAACTTAAEEEGTCVEIDGDECICRPNPPAPCGLDPATNQCGGRCDDEGEVCTACTGTACPAPCACGPEATPTATPEPEPTRTPVCPCEASCTTATGDLGTCVTVAGSLDCQCVSNQPPPVP